MQTVQALRQKFPNLQSPPSDDICYATQNRQAAVKAIAPQTELFLVVGSANSSNSVRMVEVALAAGAKAARLIENAAAIDESWLTGVNTVGLSSGASVPELLVHEVVQWLAERGYAELDEVSHIEERLAFALPQELRRDLKLTAKSS
jgi:4-hydroxy-3-methylbut-2-enyl diphosphate reductase